MRPDEDDALCRRHELGRSPGRVGPHPSVFPRAGVAQKRAGSPYRSGTQKDWIKVKARAWRGAKCGPLGAIVALGVERGRVDRGATVTTSYLSVSSLPELVASMAGAGGALFSRPISRRRRPTPALQ